MLEGGCFCGLVRYRVEGPVHHETLCHCTICRRTTGAPAVAWFTAARTRFAIVAGEPKRFASSEHAVREFCPRCGAQLTFASDGASDEIDVTTASLDDPGVLPPLDQTHSASRIAWFARAHTLPAFPAARPEPAAERP